jgi:hypothetical protein
MRVIELIFGIRRDLELRGRWWHRVAQVVFVASLAAVAALAYVGADRWFTLQPRKGNIKVSEKLVDFTKSSDRKGNTVPRFALKAEQTGLQLGIPEEFSDRIALVDSGAFSLIYCAKAIEEPDGELRKILNALLADAEIDGGAKLWERWKVAVDKRDAGPEGRFYCVWNTKEFKPRAANMVSFSYTAEALETRQRQVWQTVAGIVALYAFVALNTYYRGVVYVVCGPRKRAAGNISTPGTQTP